MATNVLATGDHGELRIDVSGSGSVRTCELYIRSTSVLSDPTLTWAYFLNTNAPTTSIFNFTNTTLWQHLGTVTATSSDSITLRLPASGTPQLGGPTDLTVDLTSASAIAPTQSGSTWTLETGDHGLLRIDDLSNTPAQTCDLYIRSTSVVAIPGMGWGWSVNGASPSLNTFDFADTTLWQHLGLVYVGHAEQITLHIPDTGHPQLGGPTDLTVDLVGGQTSLSIKVGTVWRSANAYVKVAGVWKPANVFVNKHGTWVKTL